MDKQPSEAARNAMHAALVEHDALDLNPRYPTARGVLRIDPLVTILADYAERYAAERERAALERVAEFSSVPPTTIPDWLKPGDVGYAYLVGWRDAHTDYRRAIRALMIDNMTAKETTNE